MQPGQLTMIGLVGDPLPPSPPPEASPVAPE
jgi:hypothetical protein